MYRPSSRWLSACLKPGSAAEPRSHPMAGRRSQRACATGSTSSPPAIHATASWPGRLPRPGTPRGGLPSPKSVCQPAGDGRAGRHRHLRHGISAEPGLPGPSRRAGCGWPTCASARRESGRPWADLCRPVESYGPMRPRLCAVSDQMHVMSCSTSAGICVPALPPSSGAQMSFGACSVAGTVAQERSNCWPAVISSSTTRAISSTTGSTAPAARTDHASRSAHSGRLLMTSGATAAMSSPGCRCPAAIARPPQKSVVGSPALLARARSRCRRP
jgi:hypothetical protein